MISGSERKVHGVLPETAELSCLRRKNIAASLCVGTITLYRGGMFCFLKHTAPVLYIFIQN